MDSTIIEDLKTKTTKNFVRKYKSIMEKTPIDEFTTKIIDGIDLYIGPSELSVEGINSTRQAIDDILRKLFYVVTRYRGIFPPSSVVIDRDFISAYYHRISKKHFEEAEQDLVNTFKLCAIQYPESKEGVEKALKMIEAIKLRKT
jgi:hypothetical protein